MGFLEEEKPPKLNHKRESARSGGKKGPPEEPVPGLHTPDL